MNLVEPILVKITRYKYKKKILNMILLYHSMDLYNELILLDHFFFAILFYLSSIITSYIHRR